MKEQEIIRVVRCQLNVGDELKVRKTTADGRLKGDPIAVRVKEFYPHHVLSENAMGFTECYVYFDVYQMLHGVELEERVEVI